MYAASYRTVGPGWDLSRTVRHRCRVIIAIMDINTGRWTADIDGDFVVFLLGAEVRDPEHSGRAAALLLAMVDMLGELVQDPAKGLLGSSSSVLSAG